MELNTEKISQNLFECVILNSPDPHMAQLYFATEAELNKARRTVTFLQYTLVGILDEVEHYFDRLRMDGECNRRYKEEIDRLSNNMRYARKAVSIGADN